MDRFFASNHWMNGSIIPMNLIFDQLINDWIIEQNH
jgi:hypothetical protein